MTEAKRQRRRRDIQRMKAKAIRVRPFQALAIKDAEHLQVCSGWCCGNQRRWAGPTMQERRFHAGAEQPA